MVALVPALALTGYFFGALGLFLFRSLRGGLPRDEEVEKRPASRLLGRWVRHYLIWAIGPWERGLMRLRVPADAITLGSLALAAGAAVALGLGGFALGGWLYLAAGICDILDGRIARARGQASRAGAYFDSVIDRYAELVVFGGLAVHYRATAALPVVLAAAAGSLMVSYARARGEGLGVDVRIGAMQRPERLFYLGVVVAHSPLLEALVPAIAGPLHPPVVAALALLGLSSNVTAARRILHTMRALRRREPRPGVRVSVP